MTLHIPCIACVKTLQYLRKRLAHEFEGCSILRDVEAILEEYHANKNKQESRSGSQDHRSLEPGESRGDSLASGDAENESEVE